MSTARERDWLAIAVAVALISSVYLWVSLGLAALAASGRWLALPLGAMPPAVLGLVMHPGHPELAVPASARSQLPGAVGIYVALLAPALLLWGGWHRLARRHGQLRKASAGVRGLWLALADKGPSAAVSERKGARFATPRELAALRVPGPTARRLTLGYVGRQLLAAEPGHSIAVIGPTQSGKTSGLAIPALLDWQGPVLCTSVKHDLYEHTGGWRERQGEVWLYDPTSANSAKWNPLEGAMSWQGACRMSRWLVTAAHSAPGKAEEANFWSRAAEKMLAPLLFAAATAGLTMSEVVHWLDTREVDEVTRCLQQTDCQTAQDAWYASMERSEATLTSVTATAETVLLAFQDPDVLDSACGCGVTGEQLLAGGTLYVCAPMHEQERLAPLFSALVRQTLTAAYDRYALHGRPLDPPLLVILDEAGNIAPIPDLAKLAATAAGIGVQIVSVWHDLAQLQNAYGRQGAETTLNNHRAKLILPGVSDEQTLQWVERLLGQQAVKQKSVTKGKQRSESESHAWRALAPAPLTRQQQVGEGILVYGHLPPAQLRLRSWFGDRALSERAKLPHTEQAPA